MGATEILTPEVPDNPHSDLPWGFWATLYRGLGYGTWRPTSVFASSLEVRP